MAKSSTRLQKAHSPWEDTVKPMIVFTTSRLELTVLCIAEMQSFWCAQKR